MDAVAVVLTALVALIHLYIVYLEAVLWTTPRGRAVFGLEEDFAQQTRSLALNQGLYNGFLAAALICGLVIGEPSGFAFRVFFLGCVIVAGLVGAATVSRRILVVQSVPALLPKSIRPVPVDASEMLPQSSLMRTPPALPAEPAVRPVIVLVPEVDAKSPREFAKNPNP